MGRRRAGQGSATSLGRWWVVRCTLGLALVLGAAIAPSDAGSSPVAAAQPTAAVPITPVTPARLLDTRAGLGAPLGKVGAGGTIDLTVTGVGGVPTEGVGSVVLTVTVTEPTAPSFITVWPTGEEQPTASSLNMQPGDTVPNLVVAKVGAGGRVSFLNGFGETHLIADVMAWVPDGPGYGDLTPERVLDTRIGVGAPAGAVPAGGVVALEVRGRGGVPDVGAGAVVLNVTVTDPTAPSFVTVWPNGEPQPGTSSLNMLPGQTRPNLVISKIGADGRVALANAFGSTHLIADVVGWMPEGSGYTAITPERLLDTRTDGGALGADATRTLDVSGRADADAVAVALNVTITQPTAPTFVTVWPSGVDRPGTSNLNALPGDTRPVAVIVKLGDGRRIDLYNAFGASHLIVDLVGWYGPGTAIPQAFGVDDGLEPFAAQLAPGRPLAAVSDGDGPAADFVADELLFLGPTPTAQTVANAWNGQVVSTTTSAPGLDPLHVISFDLAAIDTADLPSVDQTLDILSAEGGDIAAVLLVSDDTGATLLRLLARLLADGYDVALNTVLPATGYSDALLNEEGFDENRDGLITGSESSNAFEYTYLRAGGGMNHAFTSAWQRLDTYGQLRPSVDVAVFDGGYFDSDDLAPMDLVGTSYGSTNLAGCGGSPCPWHGTGVAHTIYGTHGNGLGTAGGATPVVDDLLAIGVGRDLFDVLKGLVTFVPAVAGNAVLNISAGVRIPAVLYAPMALILNPITFAIRALGLQIVASAGNDGADVDDEDCFLVCWESAGWIPCELNGVICVGGLQLGTTNAAAGSNYGSEDVDIWASYTVKVGPAPDQQDGIRSQTVNGTSFSAPLVSSAVALVVAADPSLSGTDAADRVLASARTGTGKVRRILDVGRAVADAHADRGSFVGIRFPAPGATLSYHGTVTLEANACCASTPTYEWREGPRNGSLVTIATGRTPTLRLARGVGSRTLEVRATFPGGVVRTDRIDYTMTNDTPTVSIERPLAGEEFFASETVPLRANAFDGAYGSLVPDSWVTWRIDGVVVGTGKERTVTGLSPGSHTAQVTVNDGNRSATASRVFTVVADPPNPPPTVSITSPSSHIAGTPPGAFVGPPFEYVFTASATSSDTAPDPTSPTITWSWRVAPNGAETVIGTGSSIEVRLPTGGVGCGGVAWNVIARVNDGATTTSDFITVTYFPLC